MTLLRHALTNNMENGQRDIRDESQDVSRGDINGNGAILRDPNDARSVIANFYSLELWHFPCPGRLPWRFLELGDCTSWRNKDGANEGGNSGTWWRVAKILIGSINPVACSHNIYVRYRVVECCREVVKLHLVCTWGVQVELGPANQRNVNSGEGSTLDSALLATTRNAPPRRLCIPGFIQH